MGSASPPVAQASGPYRLALTDATVAATWNAYTWADTNSTLTSSSLDGIAAANNPRYVVEEVQTSDVAAATGSGIDIDSGGLSPYVVYRITAKGLGSTGKTTVILQSTFRPKN
jgi:Tfp pilus assembly protein PilX